MKFNRRALLYACASLGMAAWLLPRRLFGQAGASAAAKTWFIRLIPPRPTFDKDASPAEQALMEQHFLYWKGLFEKGVCVFGGPVLDPRGVYGVLAVDAASEAEARALGENDPSVKAGVNHIEVAEMRAVFLHRG